MSELLWQPSLERMQRSAMQQFLNFTKHSSYAALHRYSIEQPQEFWLQLLHFCKIIYSGNEQPVLEPSHMPEAKFFKNVKLNFAENLLRFKKSSNALVSLSEARDRQILSYEQLYHAVTTLRTALKKQGITKNQRIASLLPNISETAIAMLATTSLGAIWSSTSPDFGVQGILDRFKQISPEILFVPNAYSYNGKVFDCREKIAEIAKALPGLKTIVAVPLIKDLPIENAVLWDDFIKQPQDTTPFEHFDFNHPLYIMFSSGTTGIPKCIVHGTGGTLLQHAKELILHSDLTAQDNLCYFTTCGWMMWNWMISGLFTGATITLFDGAPGLQSLWQTIDNENITHFGTSAKFIASCKDTNIEHKFSKLKVILSTGSPLLPEHFHWVYQNIKQDVQLSSISGGTDILSCFMLGNPLLPIYAGEIQCLGLGMDVAAFNEQQQPVVQQKAELVCRKPFVSMPIGFWQDDNQQNFRKAYFKYDNSIWYHGDFIEITKHQGVIVYGRSDATLNPGGVRIGTAEIYRLVESIAGIQDSLVIAQPYQGDVRLVLFVKTEQPWSKQLEQQIKQTIKQGATPRHVPSIILPIEKIPYTLSGKKVELAVLQIVQGIEPKNKEALADKTALDCYRNLQALQD